MVSWSDKTIILKEKISKKTILYSAIVFLLALVVYQTATIDSLIALAGLFMVIAGSVFVLFILVLVILEIVQNLAQNKESTLQTMKNTYGNEKQNRKIVKKLNLKKKMVSNKKPIQKKVISKKKTPAKKKTVSKKRK